MNIMKSEKGVTLVEVLVSITLLSIVLITLMNIFPQMGMMNKHNEDKAQAINTAKEILIDWQEADEVEEFIKEKRTSGFIPTAGNPKIAYTHFSYDIEDDGYYYFETTKDKYDVQIRIKKSPKINSNTTQVNQIIVQLLNERGNVVSETFGYVKRMGGDIVVPSTP
jgi:prepilin-type N-terminal cleavage/methylation domain-containing protein